MRLIALDASTTTIGIAILDYDTDFNIKLIHYCYFKPDKSKEQLKMVIEARDYIIKLAKLYKVNEFIIEDYVKFMGGGSTASTIIPLAILNSTLRIGALEKLKLEPVALNVLKIRHTIKLGPKPPKKEDVPDVVAKILGIEFPWYETIDKRKKVKIKPESYDVADAIAVGIAHIKIKAREQN